MKALSVWLMVVGSLRLASVWFGFFDIWALRLAVFSKSPMSEVHGRTFGVWTLLTCTLCFLCAFNLENKPLYLATLLSFVYALGHFLTEYLVYQTMAIANLSTVTFFAGLLYVFQSRFCVKIVVHSIIFLRDLNLIRHVDRLDAGAVEFSSTSSWRE